MPYKYFLKEHLEGDKTEAAKGAISADDMNPEYPGNYVRALIDHLEEDRYEYVLAPPDGLVAFLPEGREIPYTLVYPARELKGEYQQRYIARGNVEEFLEVFIGEWDGFIDRMDAMHPAKRISLGSGRYLADVL